MRDIRAARGTTLEEIARWGVKHCPVCDALERAVPITTDVATD